MNMSSGKTKCKYYDACGNHDNCGRCESYMTGKMKKTITITDFLSDDEINKCVELSNVNRISRLRIQY